MSAHDDFEDGAYQPQSRGDAESMRDAPLACRLARQRLRDFADGDLGEADLRIVEHHVHECRACALELARAEFETLRIRRAFAESWIQAKPRPGFARRALARALAQEPEAALQAEAMRRVAETDSGRPSADATPKRLVSRVMARAVADIVSSTTTEQQAQPQRGMALLLAGIGFLLLVLASPVWQTITDVSGSTRLSVVRADHASVDRGGIRSGIVAGDGLGEGDMLVLHHDGAVDAEWYDASVVGEQPAAQIRLLGDSELQVGLQLQLEQGELEILSHRPMDLLLGDGSTLELGSGLYRIQAEELAGTEELAVRVEVQRGDSARVSQKGGAVSVVSVGQSGDFGRGIQGIAVENLAQLATGSAANPGTRHTVPSVEAPDLTGSVVDAYGSPLAHASVRLSFPTAAGYVTRNLSTDHAGSYTIPAGSGLEAGVALLEVKPPAGRQDLEFLPHDARRIDSEDGRRTILPVVLGAAARVRATVRGADGHPRPYALALPVLYDEVLGQVWPWTEGAAWADADGRVELRGLPMGLPTGRSLGVVVFHPEDETAFRPLPWIGGGVFVDVSLETRAQVPLRLVGLPPSRASVVLEEVVGLPAGLGVRRHLVTADVQGQVAELRCGRGRLWLETAPASSTLHPIARGVDVAEVGGELIERRLALQPMQPVPGLAGNGLEIASQSPFREAEVEPATGEELFLQSPHGALLGDVRAFALRARVGGGFDARFLGLTQQGASLRVRLHAGESEILAIGAGEMFVRRDVLAIRGGAPHGRFAPLALEQMGRAQLAIELTPVADELRTTWTPLAFGPAGARPEMHRTLQRAVGFVAESLPPGDYQVRDSLQRTFRVRILPGQTVPIR